MSSINQVTLCGRLGQDPNIHTLENGTKVADFSFATGGENYTNRDGGKIEVPTQWHNVVAWRGLAELCEKYLKKGAPATVIGEINYRQYDDKDGNKRYATDIIARDIFFAMPSSGGGEKKASDPSQYADPYANASSPMPIAPPPSAPTTPTNTAPVTDDLPF